MNIQIPEFCLVVLIGASGSGKSTFARKHFLPTEILSSDFCRGLVADDENDQNATPDAFDLLHTIAAIRLRRGRLTVIDATSVKQEDRKPLLELAQRYHTLPVAIALNLPDDLCHERNLSRPDRQFGPHVVRQHNRQLRQSLKHLEQDGFRYVYVLQSPEEVDAVQITRLPLWTNRKHETGPFDIIGDVHGCYEELMELLTLLGWQFKEGHVPSHPDGRKAIFLGDLVDRGPDSPGVLRLVMQMVEAGVAFCVPGNHDERLLRKLRGRNVQITHGLKKTLAQLEQEPPEFVEQVRKFLESLVSHYELDEGRLVVAHAGLKEDLQGRSSRRVRDFCLYGETTGETDEFGLPVRHNWAMEYRGKAMVVYGHTPVPEAEWLNRTINIDTGCVFGGRLTALRYPERELVSVPARSTYHEPARPFLPEGAQADTAPSQETEELLSLQDVAGKRIIQTSLHHNITIREENAAAALEAMSRFAVHPRQLIYLPPTMSPCETSNEPETLEHPDEAFGYYRHQGVAQVICQQKHMGSRAVVIVCRDEKDARERFGISGGETGIVYTRTGRRFFDDLSLETELLNRVRQAMDGAGFWEELNTGWALLDCELMPWSAKAQALIKEQFASSGAAATAALAKVVQSLQPLEIEEARELKDRMSARLQMVHQYVQAYRRYCWEVKGIDDLRLAPFHLMATQSVVHTHQSHLWHMETIARLCQAGQERCGFVTLQATEYRTVDVTDPESQAQAIAWWQAYTDSGGEGMVVKPIDFIARNKHGLVQPALKVRGREYLRIIYGPEYTLPEHLTRLRARGLSHKRSLASREFALGIEGLERFVRREPLYRVHECVFGVLALESEPVDPRL